MTVDQDDLVRLWFGVHLSRMTHPDHVFRELGLALDTALALRDHERLEAFLAKPAQDFDGRDVRVPLRAASVLALGKDGRCGLAHLLLEERCLAANDERVASKAGCKCRCVHDGSL